MIIHTFLQTDSCDVTGTAVDTIHKEHTTPLSSDFVSLSSIVLYLAFLLGTLYITKYKQR